jgi:hypothetical protein
MELLYARCAGLDVHSANGFPVNVGRPFVVALAREELAFIAWPEAQM